MFWIRPRTHTAEVVHFHREGSSYGGPISASVEIRVHFAIRVFNDSFEAIALNGPRSDPSRVRDGGYHLRFNAKSKSMLHRCIDDLVRFLDEYGEPWFRHFEQVEALVNDADSPLGLVQKELLHAAIKGKADQENLAQTNRLLGIKESAKD
jgi:hypothetical protein